MDGARRRPGDFGAAHAWRGLRALSLAVALGVALGGCLTETATRSTQSTSVLDPHHRFALVDAAAVLRAVAAPPGSRRLTVAPAKDPSIDAPPSRPATPELLDRWRLWRVPGAMAAVLGWERGHVPASWRAAGSGSSFDRAVVLEEDVDFSLLVHGPLASRQVLVTVAPAGRGHVTLRVDVQEIWIPTRPAWSYVPASVTTATATVWSWPRARPTSVTTTVPATVATLRRVVNALQVSTVGVTSCPAETGARFELRLTGPSAPAVTISSWTPLCGAELLRVAGRTVGLADTGAVYRAVLALTHR